MRFYLGTYTRLGGPGVACCELRGDNGMRVLSSACLENPTYAIANARHDRLFCVSSAPASGERAERGVFRAERGQNGAGLSRQNALGKGRVTCAFRPTSGFCIWPIIPPAA